MIERVAMLSLHSSPLDQPGAGTSGGMNVYVRELARALAAGDIAVDIFTRSTGDRRVIDDGPGVRVIAVPAGPAGPVAKSALPDLTPALLGGIRAFARRENQAYDLVHSHYWSSALVGQCLACGWDRPHVAMFHTFSRAKAAYAGVEADRRRDRTEARLLDEVDAVVVSNAVERAQIRDLYGNRRAPLVSIPCGIDPAPFAHARQTVPRRTDGRFVIAALGRLERLKNFALLLRATALACRRAPRFAARVEVRIAGGPSADEPEVRDELRRLAETLGIARQVRLLGPIPHARTPAFYAAADLCVVPSLHESFGLVALEAMAVGLPVVATRVGGMQTTIVDGVSGYLVAPDDVTALAERMLALWATPALRAALGARGMRAAQHYAWPRVADRVRCLYEGLATDVRAPLDAMG